MAARTVGWRSIVDIRIAVQRGHGVGDLLFDRCDVLTGDLEIRVGSVKDLARRPTVSDERFPSRILALVEVRGIARRLELGQLLAIGGLELVDLETRAAEPRLGLIDGNLVWLRIDLEQELAPLDALIVLDGDFDHLAGNPGVDRLLRRADEGIVRRDVRLLREIVRRADGSQQDRKEDQQRATQPLPQCLLWHCGGGARVRDGRASRLNLASTSASCPALPSSIAVPEVIEVAAGVKSACMAAVMSFVFRNMSAVTFHSSHDDNCKIHLFEYFNIYQI